MKDLTPTVGIRGSSSSAGTAGRRRGQERESGKGDVGGRAICWVAKSKGLGDVQQPIKQPEDEEAGGAAYRDSG